MKTLVSTATPDLVSELLDTVRVRSTIYCRSDMRAPWGFGVAAHGDPSFHVVTTGACWLEIASRGQLELQAGDLVLLLRGPTHWVRDHPDSRTEWLDEILASPNYGDGRLSYGGDGIRTELVCGSFMLDGAAGSPILRELPDVIHIGGAAGAPAAWIAASLELVAAITASSAPGAEAVLTRVADTMLTQALRLELASSDGLQPRALRDPHIGAAVHLIHSRPHERWTLEKLAAEVGYSRSGFASRFRELVGESPMAYVTRTRLAVAATLLQRTSLSIGEVARRTGYSSQASFARAFKRAFGVAPGAYRT